MIYYKHDFWPPLTSFRPAPKPVNQRKKRKRLRRRNRK